MDEKKYSEADAHKFFAVEFNQQAWTLIAKPDRTPEEDELLVHLVHASHYHWLKTGTKVNEQRGEWMISRVYVILKLPERAMHHALRCGKLTDDNLSMMCDFDIAYSEEALARANACNNNGENCKKHYAIAKELGEKIADNEDKKIFMSDLTSDPWFGMES